MPLHPLLKEMSNQLLNQPSAPSLGVEKARASALAWTKDLRDRGLRRYRVERWEDRVASANGETVPVRIYWPSAPGPLPILIFCHGGGWVLGDVEGYDDICRTLCNATESIVVAVDYRRAPEHPFPAATDDCLTAAKWTGEQATKIGGEPNHIFLVGDSAGGNLAAVVARDVAITGGLSVAGQILIYPATDHPSAGYPSYAHVGSDYCLDRDVEGMRWFVDLYLGSAGSPEHHRFAPMRAESVVGLPSALIITAEYDPLRDEGEAYARKLSEGGVQVTCQRFDGVTHGFFHLQGMLPAADDALSLIVEWLRLRSEA